MFVFEAGNIILSALVKFAKKIKLVVPFVCGALHSRYLRFQLSLQTTEEVFTNIYKSNAWGGIDSVSGTGSDLQQTSIITRELPALLDVLNIVTMLDIPCGDFFWMSRVSLGDIDYTGADIIEELVQKNNAKYATHGVRFQSLNLIKDKLPKVDLIFCRDCLVHLSFTDIGLVLENVCNSQSEYFLTTTFTGRRHNQNISTGEWRTINLEIAPFVLPKPLKIIYEGSTEYDGLFEDKALGLWKIADLRESLRKLPLN